MRVRCSAALLALLVSCSFVRDPDRYSAGSEALDGGAGGAGGAGGSAGGWCKSAGETCLASECCTGTCFQNVCVCDATGESCLKSSDCCSGNCDNGTCGSCDSSGTLCDPSNHRCCPGLDCLVASASEFKCLTVDACLGQTPLADVTPTLTACDQSCAATTAEPARTQCYTGCVANAGPSQDCAGCYARWWLCATIVCGGDVCCPVCVTEYFEPCSGLLGCPTAG
jgi:hypothetical protein